MQFKIKNISVKLSFSFTALVLILLVTNKIDFFKMSLLSAFVHECTHILFIYIFGGEISAVTISALGGNISRKNTAVLSNLKEAVINISAPLFNILLGIVLLILFPEYKNFAYVNIFMGTFNMLPFYSFDGGVFLKDLLLTCTNESKADNIVTLLSVIVTAFFSFGSLYVFFYYSQSILPFVFSLFMLLSIIFKK